MNMFTAIVFMSIFWILFSQLNELKSANKDCCKDKSCGKSSWDKFMWGLTLTISIIMTLFVVYKFMEYYQGGSLEAKDFRRNPARSIGKQAGLLFGN